MHRYAPRRSLAALWLLSCLAPAATPRAQEFQPYPTPRITVEQFASYLAIVRSSLEQSAEVLSEKHVVVFVDQPTRTHYIFTTKDHPAHPAWITRQIVEEGGQVHVRQVGYFAGREEPFAQLFREYQRMNEQLRENVHRRNQ